ncbi:MAG: methyltransferase family protein [Candidatus Heimdallarchaeota archaeon]
MPFFTEIEVAILFLSILLVELLLLPALLVSIFFPKHRIWPPLGKRSWQFWYVWFLTAVGLSGIPLIALLDFGSLELPLDQPWRLTLGVSLFVGSVLFALWGIRTLSSQQTLGLQGELITTGPYRFTRNPQYVGDIFAILGVILITNSMMGLITGVIGIFLFIFAPFSEEPWLKEQFGEQYQMYCQTTPRFLSLKSFQRK